MKWQAAGLAAMLLGTACDPAGAASGETTGLASWYAARHPAALTAAHRSLAFGTLVEVTNLKNGRHAVVRIDDRGPFIAGRVIDLSRRAAEEIGMLNDGVAPVRLSPSPPDRR